MRVLIRIVIALVLFIVVLLGIVAWKTVPQLNFVEKE